MTFDALRTALRAEKPWAEMDRLVRAELAAGRKVREIQDELLALREKIGDIADIPEDCQDAFGDTLDALAGNCHADCQYVDPSVATAMPRSVAARADAGVATPS